MTEPQISQTDIHGSSGSRPTSESPSSRTVSFGAQFSQTVTVSEEDIDPFTYRPPLTKWDYLKVRKNSQVMYNIFTKIHRYEITVSVYPQFPCENEDPGVPKTL